MLRTLIATIKDPDGRPIGNAQVTFTPVKHRWAYSGSTTVAPGAVIAATDASGRVWKDVAAGEPLQLFDGEYAVAVVTPRRRYPGFRTTSPGDMLFELPQVIGELADVTLPGGAPDVTVNAAAVITGATDWSVSGAGASIDDVGRVTLTAEGVVDVKTETIIVTGSNSEGEVTVSFLYTVGESAPAVVTPGRIEIEDLGTTVRATFVVPELSGVPAPGDVLAATIDGGVLAVTDGEAIIPKALAAQALAAVWTVTNTAGEIETDPVTASVPAYEAPDAMAAPVPEVLSASAIRFPRPAAPENGGNAITEYRFYYTVGGIAQAPLLDVGATVDVTDLEPGDAVAGEFRAVNGAGESDPGATATATTWELPDQMAALVVTGGVASLTIAATAPANLNGRPLNTDPPGYRYEIYNDADELIGTVDRPDTSEHTVAPVIPGPGVYATVRARTDAGSGVASPASNAVTVLTGASATLAEIDSPEDVAVFDYGHALGLETADIPLELDSTDADDGAVIECRWVQYHGKGTANPDTPTGEAGDWTALGDPVSGGAASGALTITGKDVRTYRLIECRVQGSAAPASTMARKIALGHVHYDLGQSNLTKKFAADSPVTLTPDTITYPDYVQFWEPDRSDPATTGPSLVTLVNNEPGNEPMPGLARDVEVFHAAHPGEYLVLAMGAVPGVNPFEWIDPADTSRVWEHDMRMLSDLTDYGTKIGTVINSSWSSFFPQNAESMMPVLTGRNFDGSPAVLGSTLPNGETLHHSLSEVIDFDYTRVVVIVSTGRGPRTTDFPRDSLTAILNSPTGAESIAAGWETILLDKATFPEILGEPYNPETFALRGYPDGGGWSTDMIHFSNTEPSGFPRLAEVMASIKLRALGSISYDTPRITHSNWTETHIDLWNPDLDFTTERNRKGGTSAYIGGFTLDGVPLRTEVQLLPDAGGSGRTGIRITPAGGVNGAETLEYGRGGSPDLLVYPDDLLNTYVDDLPVAVVAGSLVPSLPLAVRPEITSNLEGTPQFTLDGSQGSFVDPDEIGTVNGFTLAGEFRRNSGGGGTISTTLGAVYNFEMLSDGRARISVDTPEGSIGMQQTANVVWPNGEWVPFVWTVDFINGTTTIWYGDTGEETFALTGTGAALSTTRQFRYPTGSLVADVRFTEVFKAPTAVRDTTALGTPHKRLYAGAGGTILTPSLPVWGSESVAS